MIMFKNKKHLFLLTAATLGAGALYLGKPAEADLFSDCAIRSGYTRFYDFGTDRCGYVAGNNTNWGAFGWNDRADQFGNDGNTSSNCLYQHSNYQGTRVLLRRGYAFSWSNIVSSNRWTTGTSC